MTSEVAGKNSCSYQDQGFNAPFPRLRWFFTPISRVVRKRSASLPVTMRGKIGELSILLLESICLRNNKLHAVLIRPYAARQGSRHREDKQVATGMKRNIYSFKSTWAGMEHICNLVCVK